MAKWRQTTLGEFASLQRGHDLPGSVREPGNVPVMGSFGITGRHSVAKAKGPGVTVGRSGASIGVVSYIDEDYWPLNTCLYVTDFHDNNPRFTYYFLKTLDLSSYNSGSAQPSLNRNFVHPIRISIPNRLEQDAIAQLLGALDDKIELNRRMNETLEAMARAIFKDWFVDFGPTCAKAARRGHPTDPKYDRPPYLAPELWDLFPDALDDDGKPVGWDVCKLEDFLELAYGKSLPAKQRTPGNVAVYGSGGLAGTHDTALIEGPAVIVGRKGTVGSIYWEDGPAFPIDTVFYVVSRIGSMLFNYHLLAAQPLSDMNTDAAVPGLNRGNAYRLEFPLPPLALISAFDDLADPLWKRRAKNLKETETLTQTQDLLLPKLMSGEIRLREAEKAVETVA